ncbi:c-type cytochrome [Roseomonas sp. NAR14]|uniref:C-type cytochrome n=1 Tax=Roseomonas acroporae TaxID=2937791 RepID=A0A9X1YE83_9PROT|nr:c-type cytochrome [Roseomonas acroporae]MCK8787508.1 c-type cytochrome [Roseomonas acroporae]
MSIGTIIPAMPRPRLRRFLPLPFLLLACDEPAPPAHLQIVGGNPARGRAAMLEHGCGACHVIPGVRNAVAWVGPPLTEWSRRGYVGGRLPNTPANLVRWLRDTQGISPGSAMPDLGLSEEEARDMAAYLFTLGAGRAPVQPAGMPTGPDEAGPRPEPRLRPGLRADAEAAHARPAGAPSAGTE